MTMVLKLGEGQVPEVTRVLCEAFYDYPVMRHLLGEQHDLLVDVVTHFDPSKLDEYAGRETKTTYADLITGVVLHDTYHAGQIVMLKRLAASHGL